MLYESGQFVKKQQLVGCELQSPDSQPLRTKLEMPFLWGFNFFSHALHMIYSFSQFEEESIWFSENAPWVHTFLQLRVQICHNQMQTQKCMIFKFNTNLLLLNTHFFIAYYKSIATSYHDITITVTMTIFNFISFPIILQSEVLVLVLVSLDKVTISVSKYISLRKFFEAIFHGSGTLAICKK